MDVQSVFCFWVGIPGCVPIVFCLVLSVLSPGLVCRQSWEKDELWVLRSNFSKLQNKNKNNRTNCQKKKNHSFQLLEGNPSITWQYFHRLEAFHLLEFGYNWHCKGNFQQGSIVWLIIIIFKLRQWSFSMYLCLSVSLSKKIVSPWKILLRVRLWLIYSC